MHMYRVEKRADSLLYYYTYTYYHFLREMVIIDDDQKRNSDSMPKAGPFLYYNSNQSPKLHYFT